MTDNEIMKAMECVMGNDVNCSECTYQKVLPFPSCRMMCAKNALDLINRQKAEIEKLKGSTIVSNIMESQRIKREAKAEAIKKFATKFLEKIHEHHYLLTDPYNSKDYGMFTTGIEQTVNESKTEMVGEE